MKARVYLGTLLGVSLVAVEVESTLENSHFLLSTPLEGTGKSVVVDYNRFRVIEHLREGDWTATAIGDVEHYLGRKYLESQSFKSADDVRADVPFGTQSSRWDYGEAQAYLELYRLYGGYTDAYHRVTVGLQRVSLGVGRIWNPTDLLNPVNPLALEPDEIFGVLGAVYTYTPSDLSEVMAVVIQQEDGNLKYAGRVKGYLQVVDVGCSVIRSDAVAMVGYEIEGEWYDTGIEVRSEGGWFDDKVAHQGYFQGILGADYAFVSRLTIALEWRYTSQVIPVSYDTFNASKHYIGGTILYEFDPLVQGSGTIIVNGEDGSVYMAPLVAYSLDDDMTLGVGAMLYGGGQGSEFGEYKSAYYLNWKVTF